MTPLEHLVLGLLKRDTSERKAVQALRRLQAEFVDFNELRVTQPREVAGVIQMVADPAAKAVTLTSVLQQLWAKHYALELDFLGRLPIQEARAFLGQLNGLDEQTISTVLLMSLGGNTIPADASVVRVTKRLGLVPRAWSAAQVQKHLERELPPGEKFTFHQLCVAHGEKVCLVKTTRCELCGLSGLCETARRQGKAKPPAPRRHK